LAESTTFWLDGVKLRLRSLARLFLFSDIFSINAKTLFVRAMKGLSNRGPHLLCFPHNLLNIKTKLYDEEQDIYETTVKNNSSIFIDGDSGPGGSGCPAGARGSERLTLAMVVNPGWLYFCPDYGLLFLPIGHENQ
jgi:hypothetical protein